VRVITMIRGGLKDWIQVDGSDAQLNEIIQMLDDAEQIAALESKCGGWRIPRFKVVRLFHAITFGKPIRKNLIKDGILDPRWCNDGH